MNFLCVFQQEHVDIGCLLLHENITAMEVNYMRDNDRTIDLEDSLIAWQDKYDRLHESHKRVQKVNQTLEDKLLKLVDRNSGERAQLTGDVATLSVRLAQANYNIATLQREIVRILVNRINNFCRFFFIRIY